MVHVQQSLQEAWRVLAPDGVLLEIRPANHQLQLDVYFDGQYHFAGLFDATYMMERKARAAQGLQEVTIKGQFTLTHQEEFITYVYWDTIEAMETYYIGRESLMIRPHHVLEKAQNLLDQFGSKAKIGVREILGIRRYEKTTDHLNQTKQVKNER